MVTAGLTLWASGIHQNVPRFFVRSLLGALRSPVLDPEHMYTKSIGFTLTTGTSSLTGSASDVVVLFADIRGFSNWCNTAPLDHVGEVIKIQYERVIQICNDQHHCFHKFLGDGFFILIR